MKPTTLFAAAVLFFLSFTAVAQNQSEPDSLYRRRRAPAAPGAESNWMERITLGGNFGLSLGNPTYINLAPLVGYRLTERFTPAAGVTYIYSRVRYNTGQAFSSSIYGGRVNVQYAVIPRFAPIVEYEALNVGYRDYDDMGHPVEVRRWIGNPMVGATVLFPIGRKSNFGLTGLYNLNYSTNQMYSPYPSPWIIRAGFML